MTRGPGRTTGDAPFYVAVRAAERRILRDALATFGNDYDAAHALGIDPEYLRIRAIHLGGVYEGHPEREPPGSIKVARANARAEGLAIQHRSPDKPLRRKGRVLKRRQPTTKKAKHVEQRNGVDPAHGISVGSASEGGSGETSSGAGAEVERGEDRSE